MIQSARIRGVLALEKLEGSIMKFATANPSVGGEEVRSHETWEKRKVDPPSSRLRREK
jgi:hypothetical protein